MGGSRGFEVPADVVRTRMTDALHGLAFRGAPDLDSVQGGLAMSDIVSSWVLIDRPIMDVYSFVLDIEQQPAWVALFSNVSIADTDNAGNVTAFRALVWYMGLPYVARIEVLDRIPGRRVTFRTMAPAQTATYEFEPSSKGTMVTATHRGWSWTALMPWEAVIRPLAADVLNQTLLGLKREVEAHESIAPERLIFFSYRRAEAEYVGGRIYEALSQEFGRGAVFRDIDAILLGDDADEVIEKTLERCRVVVALIGEHWEKILSEREGRNVDVLRKELETALRLDKRVIPVLVRNAQFPKHLPEDLKKLAKSQRLPLRVDPDFQNDMEKVIRAIWDEIGSAGASPIRPPASSGRRPAGWIESMMGMWDWAAPAYGFPLPGGGTER
jgi:TIR domain/Polyketide cyclase / dehydrase and lipid transport